VEDREVRSASSHPLVGEEALEALHGVDELWVAKGRNTLRLDLLRDRPDDQELLALLLGRSGKLRAPAIRVGRRLLVGFNQEILETGLA